MKNFHQPGKTLSLIAPYAVTSGEGLLVGSIFGVANSEATSGSEVEAVLEGAFHLTKAKTEAWTVGALVYWDDAKKLATTTSTNNKVIGVSISPASNPSSVGTVRLNGAFIS